MRRHSLILLFLLIICQLLVAQEIQYQFSQIDIRNGLSNNQVSSVLRDSRGFMWFGTSSGLNRYDGYKFKVFRNIIGDSTSISNDFITKILEGPEGKLWVFAQDKINFYDPITESFEHNESKVIAQVGLPNANADDIVKDRSGCFWFVYATNGLFKYDPKKKQTVHFTHKDADSSTIISNNITAFAEDKASGDRWIVHANGLLEKMDGRTSKIVFRSAVFSSCFPTASDHTLFIDAEGKLWCYVRTALNGIYQYDPVSNKLTHFSKETAGAKLNNNIVNGIAQDNEGNIWICTDHGGVNVLNKKENIVRYLVNKEDDQRTLAQNAVTTIYKDTTGIIWVGTYKKGISYYKENIIKFSLYKRELSDPESLTYDDVNRFVEDAKGNIWIGTNGGGLIYFNRQTNKFTKYTHSNSNANTIGNDVIVSLWIDHEQKLWIGSYYGGLDCFDGKTFIHYKHNPANPKSISDDRIWEIFEDSQNRLWVGTLGNGLELFDRTKNEFIHFRGYYPNSIHSNYVAAITEDDKGNIWLGTVGGIDILDRKTDVIAHLGTDNGLASNNVISILQDSRKLVWAGTGGGITIYDRQYKVLKTLRVNDGLPDNNILNILEDAEHNVWISTRNGICKISMSGPDEKHYTYRFQNFDEQDGLQGREFNENAALRTSKGELIFGGANGFNLFDPLNIKTNKTLPVVALTDLLLANKNVGVGEKIGKHILLDRSISETNSITLNYDENVFSLEFSALSFSNPEKNQYKYKLEGFDREWIPADGKNRKATYTNLGPGSYTFKVIASNDDGLWNDSGATMTIKVLPPFWKSPLAYFLYLLAIAGILYYARYNVLRKARAKFEREQELESERRAHEQERDQVRRAHELDMLKIKFLTNVSHEFRTPLSLILTPLERMLKRDDDMEKTQLQLIYRNARRLLNLVNQLLDFRKMEVKEIKLQLRQGDIIHFITEIAASFRDIAEKKNITYSVDSDVAHFITYFDHDKVERILFNLISNAFKFTPENKTVHVHVGLAVNQADNTTHLLTLKVNDTGIGMESDKLEKIFDRFFQNEIPGTLINQGSGIGLSITKEFVRIHNGAIAVHSVLGEGSTFEVTLPLKEEVHAQLPAEEKIINEAPLINGHSKEIGTEQPAKSPEEESETKTKEDGFAKKPTVLLVEDNDDFRFYLKDNLREHFNILEAENGKVGWQKALASHADLVVSDISMPVMDGIELCKKLKTDKRTAHIPVILLTAMTGEDQQLRGLETGANDYMTKPFNFEILQSRIKNLLSLQTKMRKTYQKQVEAKPADPVVSSPDEKFVARALALIEENISNPEFSVESLSKALYMSRGVLYKKMMSLTGKSPIDFIRDIRLKRAAQLLDSSQITVAEVAYEVGFNDPKYFAKFFKKEFGYTPSAYANREKQK